MLLKLPTLDLLIAHPKHLPGLSLLKLFRQHTAPHVCASPLVDTWLLTFHCAHSPTQISKLPANWFTKFSDTDLVAGKEALHALRYFCLADPRFIV